MSLSLEPSTVTHAPAIFQLQQDPEIAKRLGLPDVADLREFTNNRMRSLRAIKSPR